MVSKDTSKILRKIRNSFWELDIGIDLKTKQFFIENPTTSSSIRTFSLTPTNMCQFRGMNRYKANHIFQLIKENDCWYLYNKAFHKSGVYNQNVYKILILTPLQALVVKRIQHGKGDNDIVRF